MKLPDGQMERYKSESHVETLAKFSPNSFDLESKRRSKFRNSGSRRSWIKSSTLIFYREYTVVDLSNYTLSSRDFIQISRILDYNTIKVLNISGAELNAKKISYLVDGLQHNTSLETLIYDNEKDYYDRKSLDYKITEIANACVNNNNLRMISLIGHNFELPLTVMKSIAKIKSIRTISIGGNSLTLRKMFKALYQARFENLENVEIYKCCKYCDNSKKDLSLANLGLKTLYIGIYKNILKELAYLADNIAEDKTIKTLTLSVPLNDCVDGIAESLKSNNTIEHLNLRSCSLSYTEVMKILKNIKDKQNIRTLWLGNNRYDKFCVEKIAEFMVDHKFTISVLELNILESGIYGVLDNTKDPEVIEKIVTAFKKNTYLKTLLYKSGDLDYYLYD